MEGRKEVRARGREERREGQRNKKQTLYHFFSNIVYVSVRVQPEAEPVEDKEVYYKVYAMMGSDQQV